MRLKVDRAPTEVNRSEPAVSGTAKLDRARWDLSRLSCTIRPEGDQEMSTASPIRCWQVDAFTARPFRGNPAAICWLEDEHDAAWMQAVAAEMNLAETAFVRPLGDQLELRWFTPEVEVDLCGHATLASAHAVWSAGKFPADRPIPFQTRSGLLTCTRNGELIELDFPALPPTPAEAPERLLSSLGITAPTWVARSCYDYLVVLPSEADVRAVQPDYQRLRQIATRGVIVTAPSADIDFDCASRFFAPAVGVDEDPVCGSAHCCLAVYWGSRLGRPQIRAHQVSKREGILHLTHRGDRVTLGGQAVTVWEGNLLATRLT